MKKITAFNALREKEYNDPVWFLELIEYKLESITKELSRLRKDLKKKEKLTKKPL